MGSGESKPRKMTLSNEEPHIIEVTGDVIKRLRHGYETEEKIQEQLQPKHQKQEYVNPNTSTEIDNVGLGIGWNGQQALETVSAIEVRKEKDEELKRNDFYWRNKLKELEDRYVNSTFSSDGEFNKELNSLSGLVPRPRESICNEISGKVIDCYKSNPNKVLLCHKIIQEFGDCVESKLGKSLIH